MVLGWVWRLKDHRGDKDDSEVLSHQVGNGDMYGDRKNLRRNKSKLRREKNNTVKQNLDASIASRDLKPFQRILISNSRDA